LVPVVRQQVLKELVLVQKVQTVETLASQQQASLLKMQ
jgi:hypothetical protein